jgi:prevent-host-death family protein
MSTVNMLQAKTNLSKLVEAVESGAEEEIIIARNGKPAARLVPIKPAKVDVSKRLGLLDHLGPFPGMSLEEFNADDEEIARMFEDSEIFPADGDESAA